MSGVHLDEALEDVQRTFPTAHDITPEQHIRMQAAFQKHNDSGISKICNFPQQATVDDVRRSLSSPMNSSVRA